MSQNGKESSSNAQPEVKTTPIAIIGMGALFPQAHNTQEYWDNILHKINCISDVPESRWKIEDYYDPNPAAPDKTYCKRGGFLPDVDFDPMEFGLPPNILEVTDVSQLLSLVVARDALDDAGYGEDQPFNRERTGVVLGVVGMSSKIFTPLMTRLQYPVWEKVLRSSGVSAEDTQKIIDKIKLAYIGWEENSFPGAIGNVVAGRICNRFDLGGMNCVVDAACASSLAAVKMAVGELIEGRADMMITGGVDTDNSINTYLCFSKTPAFSKSDRVRTFDADSDGMMVGEGIGMMVLKRLEDAERDGDRVYAVIQALGTSSDGRFKSIYAPRPEGQARALRRAYQEAGFGPETVGLIEAHGTGTMAGDPSEFQGLAQVFGENNPRKQYIALGSVKSQIAHTKAAAGVASLMKTALALYHKVLPPTINVTRPNPKFGIENTPFYINTETRPWIRAQSAPPRRAGVSSFGFGGTNYHVVLQENEPEQRGAYRANRVPLSILLHGDTPADLLAACRQELSALQSDGGEGRFAALALESKAATLPTASARVGLVAETVEEAVQALQICVESLSAKPDAETWEHPKGIFYRKNGMETAGKVVALFSGQGSQYLEMGRELALNFPDLRQAYGEMDELFARDGLEPLSGRVYPRPVFDAKERDAQSEALQRTEHAQPALGAFSAALYRLLQAAGFQADFTAGHSFGEWTALWAAGVLDDTDYFTLAKARGKAMSPPQDPGFDAGTMMAVKGDVEQVKALFAGDADVTLANWNSHNQVVIAGSRAAMERAKGMLEAKGFQAVPLPVSAAFHTPLVGHAQKPFAAAMQKVSFKTPQVKVYANGTAQPHPQDPQAIRSAMEGHILNPVLFRDEILQIFADGGRIFVEFGPKNVLTNLVGNILEGKPHLAVALNANAKKDSDRQLREAVVALRVAGLPLANVDPYEKPAPTKTPRKKSPVTVRLNGGQYITEKTRMAFENALQDGFKVQGAASQTPVQKQAVEPPAQVVAPAAAPVAVDPAPVHADLGQIEQILADYQAHQSETVRLHEQYLRTEEEYARAFAQLTQLQTELVRKGSTAPGEMQAVLPLFESLERSMVRFHDHQAETLRVHQQYMENQERFSSTFTQAVGSAPEHAPFQARTVQATAPVMPAPREAPSREAPPRANGNGYAKAVEPAPAQVSPQAPASPVVQKPAVQRPVVEKPAAPLPVAAPQPAAVSQPAAGAEALTGALLAIVSDKTGYPVETLELEMDMEADLGIDSIKRVEILGAMQAQFPALPKVDASELAELRTLGKIVAKLGAGAATVQGAVAPQVVAPAAHAAPAAVAPLAGMDTAALTNALLAIVSDKTGYPVETLELEMDMEADLGIDSIKRVEILGAMQSQFPALPKVEATELAELRTLGQIVAKLGAGAAPLVQPPAAPAMEPAASSAKAEAPTAAVAAAGGIDAGEVTAALLQIVSEKTGYPVETLELEMDMEADLGIDSIKRVEILGAVQSQFPALPRPDTTALAELRTLQQIIAFLSAGTATTEQPEIQVSASEETPRPFDPGVEQGFVIRKLLPPPDALQFELPAGHACLLTDDGTPVAAGLAQELARRGWPVVVLRFPVEVVAQRLPMPAEAVIVEMEDLSEAHLQSALEEAARQVGPVAIFIHVAPSERGGTLGKLAFPEVERSLLKLVFLAAKHLKESLNRAAESGRAAFVTVTWLDGEFGLGEGTDYAPVNGGLFGLVKSLNLEWESVFCRAIDLSPSLPSPEAVGYILAELHDPNRLLIEAGYNRVRERSTLIIETTASPTVMPVTGGKR